MTNHIASVGNMVGARWRLCTANDQDGVIEQLAADLWESRRNGHLDDRPWVTAGEYWQRTFREFAEAAVDSLTRG